MCARAQKTTAKLLPDKYHKDLKKIITFFLPQYIWQRKRETILIPNLNWSEWIPTGEMTPFSCKTLACLVLRVIYLSSEKRKHSKSKHILVRLDYHWWNGTIFMQDPRLFTNKSKRVKETILNPSLNGSSWILTDETAPFSC